MRFATRNLQLTINRFNGGIASRSDITLAQTSLANAQAQSTNLRIARAQEEHATAVLTGQAPASLEVPIGRVKGPPPPMPVARPSTLLERRPDIAANECLVGMANANISIAQTAYYPTLTLFATSGALPDLVRFRVPQRPASGRPSLLRCNRRNLSPDRAVSLPRSRG